MVKLSKHSALQIATEISDLIHQHVNIMDHKGYIIASTDEERIGTFHEGAKKIIDKKLKLLIIEDDDDYVGAKKGINLPIVVDEEIVGVIGVTGEKEQVELYGQIIKKMTEILVVDTYRKEEMLVTEKIRTRYIEEWLFDSSRSMNESFIKRGIGLGIDITLPRRVLIVTIVGDRGQEDTTEEQRFLDKIEKKIKSLIEMDDETNLFIRANTKMVCMVVNRSNQEMLHLAQYIERTIQAEYDTALALGIDQQQDQYASIHKAYTYAKKALAASCMDCQNKIRFYEDITFEIFMNDIPKHAKEEFVHKVFNQMCESSIEEMLPLIEMLIACNGSINLASEQLFMHKNTLQYKLNRISEKTGHDPRRLEDVPLLYMAILFFKELNS